MKRIIKYVALCAVSLLAAALLAVCGCNIVSGGLWTDVEYDNESAYAIGGAEIADSVSKVEINWSDGSVTVAYHSGSAIKVEETADKDIEEDLKLRYLVDNGKLTVQFATNGRHDIRGLNKRLRVLIPDGVTLGSLNVDTVSGNVETQVAADSLNVETTTANVTVGGAAPAINVKTVSGKITVKQESAAYIQATSVTGEINLTFDSTAGLVVGTVSGKVTISLPDAFGFVLNLETTSGELGSELELTQDENENKYTRLNGGAVFSVNTVTGDVTILKKS